MATRVTYLVSGFDEVHGAPVKAHDNGQRIEVDHMTAAKHVRVLVENGTPVDAAVHVTWAARRVLDTLFDLPVELGLHVDALADGDVVGLQEWLETCGIDANFVEAANWLAFYQPSKPNFACLEQFGIDATSAVAVKLSFGYGSQFPGQSAGDLVIEAFFDRDIFTETITKGPGKTEVGILYLDPVSDAEDQIVGGRARDLGNNEVSKELMFHHVPVYRAAPGTATVQFAEPYGLHPVLNLSLVDARPPQPANCLLYGKFDIPGNLFLDKYQLQDLSPGPGNNQAHLIGVWGNSDLEAPEWTHNQGSVALFRFGSSHQDPGPVERSPFAIPFHGRYVEPSNESTAQGKLAAPLVFWACEADMPGEHIPGLSFESVFPDDTAFYIFNTSSVGYRIPTIDASSEHTVQVWTMGAVILGTVLILATVARRLLRSSRTQHTPNPKQKKE